MSKKFIAVSQMMINICLILVRAKILTDLMRLMGPATSYSGIVDFYAFRSMVVCLFVFCLFFVFV